MRNLNLAPYVTTTSRFPVKEGTWIFLQQSYREVLAGIIISQIGSAYSSSVAYVLRGCVASVSGGNTSFTEGAIFLNGEFYSSASQTIVTPGGGNVIIAKIQTTQYTVNADPVTFTDSTVNNVHDINDAQFASGATGTGDIGDYSDLVFIYNDIVAMSAIHGATITFERSKTVVFPSQAGAATYSLDETNAIIGNEVTLVIPIGVGFTLTLSDGLGTGWFIKETSSGSGTHVIVSLKYLGLKSALNYVTVTSTIFAPPL